MHRTLISTGLFIAFLFLYPPFGSALRVGDTIPAFTVIFPGEREDEILTEKDLYGKVTVLFYDSRHTAPTNNDLKYAIQDFQKAHPPDPAPLEIVQIIDASSANIFTRTIWKRKIRENAKRYGVPIYADWTGAMRRDLALSPKESNILIIDPEGTVRFVHRGNLKGEDRERLFAVLRTLMGIEWSFSPDFRLGEERPNPVFCLLVLGNGEHHKNKYSRTRECPHKGGVLNVCFRIHRGVQGYLCRFTGCRA